MSIIYLNGTYLPSDEARISVEDRGLLLGFGLFETLRAYWGVPFRLEDHLERLYGSAEELEFPTPVPRKEIQSAVTEVIARNDLEDARIRVTFTGGGPTSPPLALVTAEPLSGIPRKIYRDGVRMISTDLDIAVNLARHKTTGRMPRILAMREAERAGVYETYFRNPSGRVVEGATSNIFIVRGRCLATPPISEGVLPGITRDILLGLAPNLDLVPEEIPLEVDDLHGAEEVFITASVKEIVPVVKVDDRTIGDGRPGPVTRRIHQAYLAEIILACAPPGWVGSLDAGG